MGNGAIPPPHRATPRSLVGPPKVLPKESYTSPSLKSGAFQFEATPPALDDQRRLGTAIKDEQRKLDRLMEQQTALEEELVFKNSAIESLTAELKLMKQKKQSIDSELAQSTADFMNSQARWLQEVDGLNDEVQVLKSKLAQAQRSLEVQHTELKSLQERERERQAEKKKQEAKANRPDNVERQADKLEIHQNRLLIDELKALHQKLRKEISEEKALNERLTLKNEEYKDEIDQYQFLLIERTVKGDLNTHEASNEDDSLTDIGHGLLSGEEFLTEEQMLNLSGASQPTKSHHLNDTSSSTETLATVSKSNTAVTSPDSSAPTSTEATPEQGKQLQDLNSEDLQGEDRPTPSNSNAQDCKNQEDTSEKQVLKRQQFELASLRNHNRALKVSLESLVARLLENRTFSQIVEDTVSPGIVQTFRTRMAPQMAVKHPQQSAAVPNASTAASMIFNQNYTGNPTRRVFSLGVDNEVKSAPPLPSQSQRTELSLPPGSTNSGSISPLASQHTGSTMSIHSTVEGDIGPGTAFPGRRSSSFMAGFGQRAVSPLGANVPNAGAGSAISGALHSRKQSVVSTSYPNAVSVDSVVPSDFEKKTSARVESLTGVRKLRMRE